MSLNFLNQLVKSPREIGSVIPSSVFLAKKMVELSQKNANPNSIFIEFGPGTGVITEQLIDSLYGNQRLIVLEKNIDFYLRLKKKFPNSRVVFGCVSNVIHLLDELKINQKVTILSSLPWRSFPESVYFECRNSVQALFDKNKVFSMYQYTYASKNPVHFEGVQASIVGSVYLNFPPAKIWKYEPLPYVD